MQDTKIYKTAHKYALFFESLVSEISFELQSISKNWNSNVRGLNRDYCLLSSYSHQDSEIAQASKQVKVYM